MGPVAYQQPDSPPASAGNSGSADQPRPGGSGGWNRPAWARRPGGSPQGAPGSSGGPQGAPRPQGQGSGGQGPRGRKARLRVAKVDPWSVMKTTFVLSIAFAVVSVVAAALLWSALNALGVFDSINRTLASVAPANQPNSVTLTTVLSFGRVMSFTALVSVVNIVLFTALATLGAYLYNMCSSLVGGVEVTLADDTV